jgi:uncharacterized membrane protein
MQKSTKLIRNNTLDMVRTVAIVLMIVFHFIYDLKLFEYVSWDTPDGQGWREFRWVIISLFFLCLGISLTFTHQHAFKTKKFIRRVSQIASAAFVISIASYLFIPQNWIFFGVLHFLAFASCVVVWFVRFPLLCFCIGTGFLAAGILQWVPVLWPFNPLFSDLPTYTNDYVAIVPWLAMVFFGVTIAHSQWFINDPLKALSTLVNANVLNYIMWPGQHSLRIYLLHQPILVGILYAFTLAA